jgi:hypothetical protein
VREKLKFFVVESGQEKDSRTNFGNEEVVMKFLGNESDSCEVRAKEG